MRIVVDRDTCEGLGMCEAMAHEFFQLDDPPQTNARFAALRPGTPERHDEVMHVLDESLAVEHRKHLHAAVSSCPVLALTLEG